MAERGDAVALTRALVATPSVNPVLETGGAGEAAIAGKTADWLAGWGFGVERIECGAGRTSVVARHHRGAGRRLVLNGHLDTVGVAGMTVAPFGAELRDGRLYGRGACDMKAGLGALLAAARDAVEAGTFRGELVVALVADEEHASRGLEAVLAAGLQADAAVVCEPTSLAIMPAHKGFVWLELEFRGRAAHGSRPDRGVDAIHHAGLFLAGLGGWAAELESRPAHPLLGHGSVHAGTITGGRAPSVYPDVCRLVLERRTLPGETPAAVAAEAERRLAALRQEVPALDAVVTVGLSRPGTEVGRTARLVTTLEAAIRDCGREPHLGGMSAWVDAALFNEAGIPAVCFGPGSIEDAHAAAESVAVDEIAAARDVLLRFIHGFLL